MVKIIQVRLPEWAGEELEKVAKIKGLPFATVVREIVCERFNGIASVSEAAKLQTDAASYPRWMCQHER